MNITRFLSDIPLPLVSLLIPFFVSFAIFSARLYQRLKKTEKEGPAYYDRRLLRIIILLVFSINLILTFVIWSRMRTGWTAFFVLGSNGWVQTLAHEGTGKIRLLMQVDAMAALSAVFMGVVAFAAVLMALLDRSNPLTPTRAGFFILTLCGVQGVFYSNGLLSIAFFVLMGQAGIAGLHKGVPSGAEEVKRYLAYCLSTILAVVMFFAGAVTLFVIYRTDNISTISSLIHVGVGELSSFIFLVVPVLFLFVKHSPYITDAACNCFFRIVSQSAFFVIFRIVFMLYGPMQGINKVPYLLILFGAVLMIYTLLSLFAEREPAKFSEGIEQYLKMTIFIALGISMSATYTAEGMAKYGLGAIESLVSIWIIYLPLSAIFSIVSCNLKNKVNGLELWQYGGLYRQMPYTCAILFLAFCSVVGLPPGIGFVARQFLYRSSYNFSPSLMLLLFVAAVAVLAIGLKFIASVIFYKRVELTDDLFVKSKPAVLPLVLIFLFLALTASMPGVFFEGYLSPAISSIINSGEVIGVTNPGGQRN